MHNIEQNILQILLSETDPISSIALARRCGVSSRTIKHAVKIINSSHPSAISSSNKGYKLVSTQQALRLLKEHYGTQIPDTYLERTNYIIWHILICHKDLDVFGICDSLGISYSTLMSDIHKWNTLNKKTNVKIRTKKGRIIIQGAEANKRKLITNIIYNENFNDFLDISRLHSIFGQENVNTLIKLCTQNFDENDIYITDYSLVNLLLHILIIIDRIKNGQSLYHENDNKSTQSPNELNTSLNDLINKIEIYFAIKINCQEKNELLILFQSYMNRIEGLQSTQQLAKLIGDENFDFIDQVIKFVKDSYTIDLSDTAFVMPFGLHLKTLLFRCKNNKFNKNPLLNHIRQNYPVLYEIAITIATLFEQYYHMSLNEDEIAFFAIHIGTELERQKSNRNKISTVILCPDYLGNSEAIYKYLAYKYSEDLNFIKVVSSSIELQKLNFELLITCLHAVPEGNFYTYKIPPFLFDSIASGSLDVLISQIKNAKTKAAILEFFSDLFDEKFFFTNCIFESKNECIAFLCDQLKESGYVDDNYIDNVLMRESISSTEFKGLAVPHALNQKASKTVISVALFKDGLKWDTETIYIVLMPAVTEKNSQYFADLYGMLISTFYGKANPSFINSISSYASFKDYVYKSL